MNRIFIAFPGTGKTTYVKHQNQHPRPYSMGAIDLDIKGPSVWKAARCPESIRNAQSRYVQSVLENGADVCTHVWAINPYWYYDWPIYLIVPRINCMEEWIAKVRARDGDCQFVADMAENWKSWIDGWYSFADKLRLGGNDVEVISVGANDYLLDIVRKLDLAGDLGGPSFARYWNDVSKGGIQNEKM